MKHNKRKQFPDEQALSGEEKLPFNMQKCWDRTPLRAGLPSNTTGRVESIPTEHGKVRKNHIWRPHYTQRELAVCLQCFDVDILV